MRDYASLYSQLLEDLGVSSVASLYQKSDSSCDFVARRHLAASFLKKLCPVGNAEAADDAALKKFKAINQRFLTTDFDFKPTNEPESLFYDIFVDEVNSAVGSLITENDEGQLEIDTFDTSSLCAGMGVGPGANRLADASTFVTKLFESPMSYTSPALIPLYRGAVSLTGYWADAEMLRFQKYGFVPVEGGKIFFAKKNVEISRTCCTEPLLNMLFQKALGSFLEVRLARIFGIRLDTQPDLNREMARVGSIDNSFATIDLASASDCIGLSMISKVLRPSPFRTWLLASRCEQAVLPDGSILRLGMVSTMGNGFTFPLQTLLFACAVKATYDVMGLPMTDYKGTKNFGVFGDDICVRTQAAHFLMKMLEKLGFLVNDDKSFTVGPFRESCGYDYFSGVNVRGVYIVSLETDQQVYSAINRLNRWSALHGRLLLGTIKILRGWLPRGKLLLVPPSESDDAGLHVPFKLTRPIVADNYWFKYWSFTRRSKTTLMEEEEIDGERSNTLGQAVSFLSGHARRRDVPLDNSDPGVFSRQPVRFTLRDAPNAVPRYKVETKYIPYWDLVIPESAHPKKAENGLTSYRHPLTRMSHHLWEEVMVVTAQIF